jgi:hypothetical protein
MSDSYPDGTAPFTRVSTAGVRGSVRFRGLTREACQHPAGNHHEKHGHSHEASGEAASVLRVVPFAPFPTRHVWDTNRVSRSDSVGELRTDWEVAYGR